MDDLQQTQNNHEQVLLKWRAPLRPYKKRSGRVLRFYIALTVLLSVIVYFFGDYMLFLPLWALSFLFFVFTITPPPDVDNIITEFGVETAGVTTRWDSLSYFYFSKRFGFDVVTLVGASPYYFQSYMVAPDKKTLDDLNTILSNHLMYLTNPPKTITDRLVDILTYLVPDEEEESSAAQAAKI